ncbi:MAG: hypothetical protein ACI8TQ_000499 [Planctomycetota bacterium]|jgi:hypothetical protein
MSNLVSRVKEDERPDLRYEIKMVCQASSHGELLARVQLSPAGVTKLYPPRQVQSIYFDTLHGRALEENLSGVSHREKVRFRWYGPDRDVVRGKLEQKVRENMLGWKHVIPIDKDIRVTGSNRTQFAKDVLGDLTGFWARTREGNPMPVQWISYQREYYSTSDNLVRITVDRNVETFDQRNRFLLSAKHRTPTPNLLIVEAKCAAEHYDYAKSLLNRLPLRVDKCSKFVIASRPGEAPDASLLFE